MAKALKKNLWKCHIFKWAKMHYIEKKIISFTRTVNNFNSIEKMAQKYSRNSQENLNN